MFLPGILLVLAGQEVQILTDPLPGYPGLDDVINKTCMDEHNTNQRYYCIVASKHPWTLGNHARATN